MSHDLLGIDVNHGHSLQIADINGDGNLDIFCAEMGKWTQNHKEQRNPNAKAWIFYGDGKGHFQKTVLATGYGFHEGRIADLDGDGDLDVLDKPYSWETPRVDVWLNNGTGRKISQDHIFKGPLGLELYSLRHELNRDFAGTLDQVKRMGFKEVELPGFYGMTPREFRRQLDPLEIKCTSIIFSYKQFRDHMAEVIENAKIMGAKYVVCAWIPHKGKLTLANIEKAVREFNDWGKELKAHGLRFCYHPHGYEFLSAGHETLFDELVQRTRPEWVSYEMDIFWIVRSGQDPVKLLQKYPHRFPLMHLKDMRKGTPVATITGKAPKYADVALGEGKIDIPAILREASKNGVKHYYIEDESSQAGRNIFISLSYLRNVRF
jgi:sugar phosphate isomerase/epimerase